MSSRAELCRGKRREWGGDSREKPSLPVAAESSLSSGNSLVLLQSDGERASQKEATQPRAQAAFVSHAHLLKGPKHVPRGCGAPGTPRLSATQRQAKRAACVRGARSQTHLVQQ